MKDLKNKSAALKVVKGSDVINIVEDKENINTENSNKKTFGFFCGLKKQIYNFMWYIRSF